MSLEPRPTLTTTLTVHDPEDFREALPSSGVFDIFDCRMLLEFSPHSVIQDLEKYVMILESCINIVDMDVQPDFSLGIEDGIKITITEVPLHIAENRNPPARMYKRPGKSPKPANPNRLQEHMDDEDGFDIG